MTMIMIIMIDHVEDSRADCTARFSYLAGARAARRNGG